MKYEEKKDSFQSFNNEESGIAKVLNDYMLDNPKTGYLDFSVYFESPVSGLIPLQNAVVSISKELGDGFYIVKMVLTDENGETGLISMPTVDKSKSMSPINGTDAYSVYNARIEAPGFQTRDYYGIQIFEGITTTQNVNMLPILKHQVSSAICVTAT